MCGINGILRLTPDASPVDREELRRTRDYMRRRGPDGAGEWVSPSGLIGLGHRRLAIIDLSPAGAQPMSTADGCFHIVFNGEIYNYRELRVSLERDGAVFRSQSDTEVILELYRRLGPGALSKLRGMYAIVIWDERERSLFLARDPYGIKPLYYSQHNGTFRFASQVRALEASGALPTDVDPGGLVGFLLWGSVPEPFTIRKAIRAVPAGHWMKVADGEVGAPTSFEVEIPEEQLAVPVEQAIEDSIRAHLVADVPVAIFLSAGLDSAMIAAAAVRNVSQPPVTFTARFDTLVDTPDDEGPLAATVARILGTRHIEHLVHRDDFPDLWHGTLAAMDQPSIDGFNTFVISEIAAEHGLKVVLSGLGGDELFGSYPSFTQVPQWARRTALLRGIPGARTFWPMLSPLVLRGKQKARALLELGPTIEGSYFLRRGLFLPDEIPSLVGKELACAGLEAYDPLSSARSALSSFRPATPSADGWEAVHILETCQYMRNQLLRDSDWASMAHSLELRVPFVDAMLHRLVSRHGFEPARSKGKTTLARCVAPELPEEVIRRRKTGFNIPIVSWLSGRGRTDAGRPGRDSRQLAYRLLSEFCIGTPGSGSV